VLPPRAESKASRASAMVPRLPVTGGMTQYYGQEGFPAEPVHGPGGMRGGGRHGR
jgi:hypothetical protein